MANYNKSFNFRNGVQVDDDNFIVNANGLVGLLIEAIKEQQKEIDELKKTCINNHSNSKRIIWQ